MNYAFIKEKLDFIKLRISSVLNMGSGGDTELRAFFSGKEYKTLDLDPRSGADFIGDAHQTGIPDASFDAIISFNLIEHTHTPHQVVSEMYRMLKPGGWILISVPFIHPYHGGNCPDYYRFTKDGLKFLFSKFSDVEMGSDGGLFYALQDFIPPALEGLRPVFAPILRGLDSLFTKNRASVHQLFLFAKK